jgi:TatA/E family protein of Tat protein translocase
MIAPAVPLLAFGLPHGMDWIWILVIVILIFGPKKLPDLARGIGRSLGEFRKAKDDFDRELKESMKDQPKPVAVSPVSTDPLAPVATSTASGTPGTPPGAVPPAAPLPAEPKKEA